ncbi:unnamed protein product [marine sediment metagenome]|uniref:Uncharacterized protein n=1 Tax=marine sediment metagenome TaxID=412755 RepID=X1BLP6_9ZZZZ
MVKEKKIWTEIYKRTGLFDSDNSIANWDDTLKYTGTNTRLMLICNVLNIGLEGIIN